MEPHTTRLAPSPTGALHLGNARTFLVNWAMARRQGWRVILRIEDLDTPRVKPETIEATRRTLAWLGMDWDEEVPLQSADPVPYTSAMQGLAARGLVYPCELSRSEIEQAAGAPNEGEHETRFPPSLRPASRPAGFTDRASNWRFVCPSVAVTIEDGFRGPSEVTPSEDVGDFVIWTRRGHPAYQLAVVVDDARQGVTQVVRGDDLLPSAGRQALLYEALGLAPMPSYTHLPLVRGEDGRRLAKRHGDTRIDAYARRGVPPERMVALLARWSGIGAARELSASGFAERFDLDRMPADDVVFTAEDDRWLLESAD